MSTHNAPFVAQDETENGLKHVEASSAAATTRSWPGRLPAWLVNIINPNDWKILLRCWAAVWVAIILILIDPVLQNFGIAAFFGAIVLYITPPAGIFMVYLLASLSLLLGMCLAWAWGLLSMKAALSVRSDEETSVLLRSLQQQAAAIANQTGQPPASIAQALTYEGHMLDARVVAIFFVMSCVFIYALARVRYANSKLILFQLFGTIVTDIFILSGPILTKFNATLAQVLVKPGAVGVGVGAACSLLIFPQSASYVVLSQMESLTRLLDVPLRATQDFLNSQTASQDRDLNSSKTAIIAALKALEPGLAFLPLDFSRGWWNAEDVKSLYTSLREATAASLFLVDFHTARELAAARADRLKPSQTAGINVSRAEKPLSDKTGIVAGERSGLSGLVHALRSPEQSSIRPDLLSTLRDTTADILQTTSRAIGLAAEAIHTINHGRWSLTSQRRHRIDKLKVELAELCASLQTSRAACITATNRGVVNVHADLFDENGQLKKGRDMHPLAINGIILSMVLEERILGTAAAMESVLSHMVQLLEQRTAQRIWMPARLAYVFTWFMSKDATAPVPGSSTIAAVDPDDLREHDEQIQKRLRMIRTGTRDLKSRPVRRQSVLTKVVVGTYKWLFNPGGAYALRMMVVTIALSVPAVLPSTAGFFYREKGIWAVIMGQTCLLMYMADFTFSLICRGAGTLIGGLFALAAWYIGSGNGDGNVYGLGATTAVASLFLIWCRVFLPIAYLQASVMAGATFVLIIGFSWDQHHIASYGLPGMGYTAFWKRLVTVFIGFAAAFIIQIFPKPPSATRYVCKTLANNVRTLNDHFALLLSQWGLSRSGGSAAASSVAAGAAAVAAEKMTLKVSETLLDLDGPLALLKVEISTLPFDQKILTRIRGNCNIINQCLGKLLVLSSSLPKPLQNRLTETSGLLDATSVANVMSVLSILEICLRTGCPVPQRLPLPLVETCFLNWFVVHERAELSVEMAKSEDYRRYCVAISCYLSFLSAVDDMADDLKGTLGETHVVHEWSSEV